MLTRCPSCQTIFRLDIETLEIAQGLVRCGRCAEQFNAQDNLLEELQAPVESDVASAEAATQVDQVSADAAEPMLAESPSAAKPSDEAPEQVAHAQQNDTETVSAANAVEPPLLSLETIAQSLLIEDQVPPASGWRGVGALLALGLLTLLVGQWLYMQRLPLYERPLMRPVLERYCAIIGCDLPLLRLPERIEVLDRSVREHPRVAGALLATIKFISRADQPIAYPQLLLQLGDVSGNRVVGRRFTPVEYLPPGVDIQAGIGPGQSMQIALELVEPKLRTVSFHFEFY